MDTPSPTPQEQQVLAVFRRHVAAFNAGDLDAVLGDFHEHAVVITPEGVFEGPDRIRAVYDGLLKEFGATGRGDSPGFSFDAVHVRYDTLFITWHAESMRHVFPFGADTFVCKDDKFERQSIAFSRPLPRNRKSTA
jgi:SnoaL-like domain